MPFALLRPHWLSCGLLPVLVIQMSPLRCRQKDLSKLSPRLLLSHLKPNIFIQCNAPCSMAAWFSTPSFIRLLHSTNSELLQLSLLPPLHTPTCMCICMHTHAHHPCVISTMRKTEHWAESDLTDWCKHPKTLHEERDKQLIPCEFGRQD